MLMGTGASSGLMALWSAAAGPSRQFMNTMDASGVAAEAVHFTAAASVVTPVTLFRGVSLQWSNEVVQILVGVNKTAVQ